MEHVRESRSKNEAFEPQPLNSYNYCNAPHVNAAHYSVPSNSSGAELVYMNVMVRHHKVRSLPTFLSLPCIA